MTNTPNVMSLADRLQSGLDSHNPSTRLQAALTAGTTPDPTFITILMRHVAAESDFFVRDMITWALTRHDHDQVVPHLVAALSSPVAQAQSQALHTLSKLGDPTTWQAITTDHLVADDDEIARTAWRTVAGLVPPEQQLNLASILATQFGRGDHDVQRSLSAAFVTLGDPVSSVIEQAQHSDDARVRIHATATLLLMANPEAAFETLLDQAQRVEEEHSGSPRKE